MHTSNASRVDTKLMYGMIKIHNGVTPFADELLSLLPKDFQRVVNQLLQHLEALHLAHKAETRSILMVMASIFPSLRILFLFYFQ